jgi:broad specificity phosphatase PhoE
MRTNYLIPHGETQANREEIFRGRGVGQSSGQ